MGGMLSPGAALGLTRSRHCVPHCDPSMIAGALKSAGDTRSVGIDHLHRCAPNLRTPFKCGYYVIII